MKQRLILSAVCLFLVFGFSVTAWANIPLIPDANQIGQARFSRLFWNVYDIALYVPAGQTTWNENQPHALRLTYLRSLSGRDIAERSSEEISNLGFQDTARLQDWTRQMIRIFPDITNGTILTGVRDEKGQTHFFKDQTPLGTITDPEFSRWFFGIWLNPKTSEPSLRRRLLNLR